MSIRIIPTNSIRTILAYWLKCTCCCQSRVEAPWVPQGSWGSLLVALEASTCLAFVRADPAGYGQTASPDAMLSPHAVPCRVCPFRTVGSNASPHDVVGRVAHAAY